jgi:DNA invertase Pin-like site-specific DNA recombinase
VPAQRYYNLLCLAYGEDPRQFADLVEKKYLPESRAQGCVDEYHTEVSSPIFSEPGGAEFHNRPGLKRLLNDLKQFDVVIMSEVSRLGRDMLRNAVVIDEIVAKGRRLFYYLSNEEQKADTPEQRVMVTLKSYAAEVEREKASQRSRDALERKAQRLQHRGRGLRLRQRSPVWNQSGRRAG